MPSNTFFGPEAGRTKYDSFENQQIVAYGKIGTCEAGYLKNVLRKRNLLFPEINKSPGLRTEFRITQPEQRLSLKEISKRNTNEGRTVERGMDKSVGTDFYIISTVNPNRRLWVICQSSFGYKLQSGTNPLVNIPGDLRTKTQTEEQTIEAGYNWVKENDAYGLHAHFFPHKPPKFLLVRWRDIPISWLKGRSRWTHTDQICIDFTRIRAQYISGPQLRYRLECILNGDQNGQ